MTAILRIRAHRPQIQSTQSFEHDPMMPQRSNYASIHAHASSPFSIHNNHRIFLYGREKDRGGLQPHCAPFFDSRYSAI